MVEQFRPGVMRRLGLDYATLRAHNPRLIYCSISGCGQDGPRAQESGHDLNYIGSTGFLALRPGPSDSPVVPPMLVADIAGGSMTGIATSRYPGACETLLTGGSPRYQFYPTRDDRLVACAALEQKFWLAFTDAIGLAADLVGDRRDPAATRSAVARIIAEHDAAQWEPLFARANCCVTIVATLEEAVRDPHFAVRGPFAHQLTAASGARIPALPVPIAPAFRQPTAEPVAAVAAADPTAPRRA